MAERNAIVRVCEVLYVDDPTDGGRIKVRLLPDDNGLETSDIPWVWPLLPKMFFVKPKVGEAVLIILAMSNDGYSQRYYIGPIISQPNKMEIDRFNGTALTGLNNSVYPPGTAPSTNPNTEGAYPGDGDVAVMGRKGSELVLKPNDARLECGVRKTNPVDGRDIVFNKTNPSYVKLTYNPDGEDYKSTANIVADRINLIGNESKDYFNTTDKKSLISPNEMAKIVEKAHQLPYGDVLLDFLTILRDAFVNHVHPFPTMPACQDDNVTAVANYDLDKMLSESVRIN